MRTDTPTIKKQIIEEIAALSKQHTKRVCFVQFGTDAASTQFVAMKGAMAKELGIEAEVIQSAVTDTAEALSLIGELIEKEYDGMVIQLPLPEGMDTDLILDSIPTEMDIDLLSEDAIAQYRAANTERTAPVAAAIQELLWHHKIILIGKKIVVLGKGRLVGQPIMLLLDRQELPYEVFDVNSNTEQMYAAIKEADVVITGTGMPHSITADMVKDGVVLIDAGTSEQNGKLVGDIAPDCYEKAQWYTPVPGGVGPLTVVCLLRNLFLN